MPAAGQVPLLMPPLPPPIDPGLRVHCLPGAVPAAYGYPVAEVVSIGPTRVAVRILGEPHTVRRVDPRRLEVFLPPLTVWHGYHPRCIRGRGRPGDYPQLVPAPGWAWTTWSLAEHLRGDLDPGLDLAPGECLPDPAGVHPDDLAAFRRLRIAPAAPQEVTCPPGPAGAHPGGGSAAAASATNSPTRTGSPRRWTPRGSGSSARAATARAGSTRARPGTASTAHPGRGAAGE